MTWILRRLWPSRRSWSVWLSWWCVCIKPSILPMLHLNCTSPSPHSCRVSQKYFISGYIHSIHSNAGSSFFLRIYFTRIWKRAISTAIITAAKERFPHRFSLYCWFARYVTAAMLVVKNKSISLLWELNSIFIFSIFYFH